jgi:hypothetical protein
MAFRDRRARVFAALVCALATASCWGIRVGADRNRDARVAELRSWSWMPASPSGASQEEVPVTPLDRAIQSSVEAELAALGYEHREGGAEPDFWVAYHRATDDKLNAETLYRGYPPVAYSGVYPTETYVPEYDEGTLLVDVIRAEPRELLWRGWARRAVHGSGQQGAERVRTALARLFERFPAHSGAAPPAGG